MKNILKTAIEAGSFKTLVYSVKKAELVEVLNDKGPFTVFAPADEAFAKLPKEMLEKIVNNRDKLTSVLKYHVVLGKIMSKDMNKKDSVKTLQGGELSIDTSYGVRVNEANVVKTDIECKNGVIHVIDSVLFP